MKNEHTLEIMQCSVSDEDCEQIQAEYQRYCAAFADKDIETIMELMAPDFVWKLPEGESMDRNQTRAAILEQMSATVDVLSMSANIEQITLDGNCAVASVRENLVATVKSECNRLEHLSSEETYRDIWMKTPLGWKFHVAELLTSETALEPINPA